MHNNNSYDFNAEKIVQDALSNGKPIFEAIIHGTIPAEYFNDAGLFLASIYCGYSQGLHDGSISRPMEDEPAPNPFHMFEEDLESF
jgi:hypothetical protein